MLESQGGCCAICRQPEKLTTRLHVDHDHRCCNTHKTCGMCVRGLLCANCNHKLSTLEDVEWVEAANKYLGQYGKLGKG